MELYRRKSVKVGRRLLLYYTDRLSNLIGGVMTPPYKEC